MHTENKLPDGFASPTALPDAQQQREWQRSNRAWWENNPMRYDWNEALQAPEFSREFYQEIDKRFFHDAARYMPPRLRPFDRIVPFAQLPLLDVLEIGVGNGSHAQLLAPHCKSYTGIDLTRYATASTRKRFDLFGLKGNICLMDAEDMAFADASFDFIWTWGVIHHSANTGQVVAEMHRVLRPGRRAVVMIYHRSLLYTFIFTVLIRGVLCGGLLKHTLHELLQLHTDGAIARFYLPQEWRELVLSKGFILETVSVMGQKSELFPLPAGRVKNFLMTITPNFLARFVTNTCRQGSFLITTLRKA